MADDIEKIKEVVKNIEQNTQRLSEIFLERVSLHAEAKLSEVFKTEGRALGVEWSPLKEAYLKWKMKKGFSEKKLHRTTTLAQSFTSKVSGLEAIVGTPVPYSIYHEFGTRHMPARPFMKPVAEYMQNIGLKKIFESVFKEVYK